MEIAENMEQKSKAEKTLKTKKAQINLNLPLFSEDLDKGLHISFTPESPEGENASQKTQTGKEREWMLCQAVLTLLALGAATLPENKGSK